MNREFTHGRHRLADKIVYSRSKDATAVMKHTIRQQHQNRVRIKRAAVAMAIALVGALGWLQWNRTVDNTDNTNVPAPIVANGSTPASNLRPGVDTVQTAPQEEVSVSPIAVPLTPGTRFSVEEDETTSTYRIDNGGVRFETQSDAGSKLLVRVGNLLIEDIGTVFSVELLPSEQVRVAVSEGRVIVTWPTGHTKLARGANGVFPINSKTVSPSASDRSINGQNKDTPVKDWRVLARTGQIKRAAALIKSRPGDVRYKVADLMLAADVMRASGNSSDAKRYLKKVVRGFTSDHRRSSAAFVLGKVYLNDLNMPRAAARAFAVAATYSHLAEEAKAREVDAWYRAKAFQKACRTAKEYIQKYPSGVRADSVRAKCESHQSNDPLQ